MVNKVKVMILLFMLFCGTGAWAAGAQVGGKIKQLAVWSGGVATVALETPSSTSTACALNKPVFALNLNNDAGRAMYSTLLAARKAGTSIIVWGSGACTVFTGFPYEDVAAVIDQN